MTESRPPYRTSEGTEGTPRPETSADHDTTALPRVEDHSNWSAPGGHQQSSGSGNDDSGDGSGSRSSGSRFSGYGFGAGDNTVANPFSGLGSKLTAAGATAVAAAQTAASTAKEAVRNSVTETPSSGPRAAQAPSPGPRGNRVRSTSRQPRKARLTLSHINVYSVFKFSCVLAIALFFVWLIMVGVLYGVLDVSGVLDKVNQAVARISGSDSSKSVVSGSLVFGSAIIIGAVYIVLFIAISTVGSMIYNLCADLVGGAEVTLSERE